MGAWQRCGQGRCGRCGDDGGGSDEGVVVREATIQDEAMKMFM